MWTAIIEEFLKALGKLAETQKSAIENQSETTVNKNVKSSSKAIKAANKALDISTKYCGIMSKKDSRNFQRYKRIFDNNL